MSDICRVVVGVIVMIVGIYVMIAVRRPLVRIEIFVLL